MIPSPKCYVLVSGKNVKKWGVRPQNLHFNGEHDDNPLNLGVLHPSFTQIEYTVAAFFLGSNYVGSVFWQHAVEMWKCHSQGPLANIAMYPGLHTV